MKKSIIFAAIVFVTVFAFSANSYCQDSSLQRINLTIAKLAETKLKMDNMQRKIEENYRPSKSAYWNNITGQPIALFTNFQSTFQNVFSTLTLVVENPTPDNLKNVYTLLTNISPQLNNLQKQLGELVNTVEDIDADKLKKTAPIFEIPKILRNAKLALETTKTSLSGLAQMIAGAANLNGKSRGGNQSIELVSTRQ